MATAVGRGSIALYSQSPFYFLTAGPENLAETSFFFRLASDVMYPLLVEEREQEFMSIH